MGEGQDKAAERVQRWTPPSRNQVCINSRQKFHYFSFALHTRLNTLGTADNFPFRYLVLNLYLKVCCFVCLFVLLFYLVLFVRLCLVGFYCYGVLETS